MNEQEFLERIIDEAVYQKDRGGNDWFCVFCDTPVSVVDTNTDNHLDLCPVLYAREKLATLESEAGHGHMGISD